MKLFGSKPKIFVISFQRTGTTSTGKFFKDHGFKVQGYDNQISVEWSGLYFEGAYQKIWDSPSFKNNQVFEDNPWWIADFYRVVFHQFPDAKFVLFTRDSDKWFDSMVSHSDGKTLGNTYRHSRIYRREEEFDHAFPNYSPYQTIELDNLLPLNESHRKHYIELYERRNREIIEFFNAKDATRLIKTELENPAKWQVLSDFFGFTINENYESYVNKSKK